MNNNYLDKLRKAIDKVAYSHRKLDVFYDFIALVSLAISNTVDKKNFKSREEQYLSIIKKYDKASAIEFAQMYALLVLEMQKRFEREDISDILGALIEELGGLSKSNQQFFTSPNICQLMTSLIIDNNVSEIIAKKGFITMNEPCSGSGRLVLSYANNMKQKGYNFTQQLFVVAQDIDINCTYMTYIQLSLYGIPAIVEHKDTLADRRWSVWYTPVYIFDRWYSKNIFEEEKTLFDISRDISTESQNSIFDVIREEKISE